MRCPPQERGIFGLLFVAAWTKSKASGGTRPAGLQRRATFGENHFWALEAFSAERARKRKVDIGTLIHAVLRKEMD